LSFKKKDRFVLKQLHDSGWWIVENKDGETGIIPSNYVKVVHVR